MSPRIRYAYLKGHTWLYRRNYPVDVAMALGSKAYKQSLKTASASEARVRAAEVNAQFETLVSQVRSEAEVALSGTSGRTAWGDTQNSALGHLRATLAASGASLEPIDFSPTSPRLQVTVAEAARTYLGWRSDMLRHGGFKSVRYSVGLFVSHYGALDLSALGRDEGREFLNLIARLSPIVGKSEKTRGLSLRELVAWSDYQGLRITARTQKRIWSQVNHFLDWAVYEGQMEQNPFKKVRFDGKVQPQPYAAPTDAEVKAMLDAKDPVLHVVLLTCLLSGLRAGEAAGLLSEDLVEKGSLGWFIQVRPNRLRLLKTDAAKREVPLHPRLIREFRKLPSDGPLFPSLSVNDITKRFAVLRHRLGLERQGLVFHSSRKWFVTQCERAGVPEHWTASIVGHQSARSENGLTYGIYSAGISDGQKRGIVDQIKLPT